MSFEHSLSLHVIKEYSRVLFFSLILVFLIHGYKKSPTTPQMESPGISVTCTPASGGTGTAVTVSISIKASAKEIKGFGLELAFEAKMFQFESAGKGSLTGSWAAVDGNEASPGTLKIGGYMGGGSPIAKGSNGTLVEVKLKVTGAEASDGQQSPISIKNYSDDLDGMIPNPASTTFTFKKLSLATLVSSLRMISKVSLLL